VELLLASEQEAKDWVEQRLAAERAASPPADWFWAGHPGDDGVAFIANRAARAALAAAQGSGNHGGNNGGGSSQGPAVSAEQKAAWEEAATARRVRTTAAALRAAHGRAAADRRLARDRLWRGPLAALCRPRPWTGDAHAHGPSSAGADALPLQAALETIYALLDAKLKQDRNDMLVTRIEKARLGVLASFSFFSSLCFCQCICFCSLLACCFWGFHEGRKHCFFTLAAFT
jgi:hypothetical protein